MMCPKCERLVVAAEAVVEMLPHGSDRYELAISIEEAKARKDGRRITLWKELFNSSREAAAAFNVAAERFGILTKNKLD